MRIQGQTIAHKTARVIIGQDEAGKDITVLVQALPLGYNDIIGDRLPEPVPPLMDLARGHRGAVLRDEHGNAVVLYNEKDEAYVTALQHTSTLQTVAMVYKALELDDTIVWETTVEVLKPACPADWKKFYQALAKEMEEARLNWGAVNTILKASNQLSGLDSAALERVEATFRRG